MQQFQNRQYSNPTPPPPQQPTQPRPPLPPTQPTPPTRPIAPIPPTPPPMPPPPVNQSPAPLITPKRSGSGFLLKLVLIVVILAAIAGAGLLFARVWDPVWNPFRPNPQTMLEDAFNKMSDWKTMTTNTDMTLDVKDEAQGLDISLSVNGQGLLDNTDANNQKSSSSFSMSADIGVGGTVYQVGIGLEQVQVSNSLVYLNIKSITIPQTFAPILATMGINLDSIKNQWIKIDTQEIQQLTGVANTTPALTQDQQKQITEQIQEIFLTANLNKIKEQLSDESIDSQKMYHYLVTLDKDELKKAVEDFINAVGSMLGNMPDASAFDTQLDAGLLAIGDLDYQVWIGQQEGELHKVKFAKAIDLSKFDSKQNGTFEIGFEMAYSNINQPVVITEPATSKTLQEALPFIVPMINAQKDQMLMNDMVQLRNIAESVHTSDSSFSAVTCLDARVKPFCDSIKDLTGQDPVIHQSNDKYCAYVKMLAQNKYICVVWKNNTSLLSSYSLNPISTCTATKFNCPSR